MNEMVELINEHGLSFVMAGLLLYMFYKSFTELKPMLDRIDASINFCKTSEDALKDIIESNNNALEQVSKSNDNVAHSLELLNKTMEHVMDITRRTEVLLREHDNRLEKTFTIGKENRILNERILTNQVGNKEAKEEVENAKLRARRNNKEGDYYVEV